MQSKICNYLERVKGKQLKENGEKFTIGEEATGPSQNARYFKIEFTEVRTDIEVVQITPMICTRIGYIEINCKGNISLTDNQFNPYRSSTVFSFNELEDKLVCNTDWKIASKERFSSRCIKVGFFALGAAAVSAAIAGEVMKGGFELQM